MTPQQTADQALSIYQTSRRQARETIAALLDEFFVGEEYTATIETVRNCMCEPEGEMTFPEEHEMALQFALVEFRTMDPEMQSAFLVGAMDELIEQARAGKVDKYAAEQIHRRAEHIYANVVLPKLRGVA